MQRFRAAPGLALVIVVAALAGCGGSDSKPAVAREATPSVSGDQRSILATVDALETASRKGDGRAICGNLFTPQLVKSIAASAKRGCAKEVRQRLFAPDAEISVGRDLRVTGLTGTAVIREQNGNVSKLALVKQSGRWRIDRVTPQKSG